MKIWEEEDATVTDEERCIALAHTHATQIAETLAKKLGVTAEHHDAWSGSVQRAGLQQESNSFVFAGYRFTVSAGYADLDDAICQPMRDFTVLVIGPDCRFWHVCKDVGCAMRFVRRVVRDRAYRCQLVMFAGEFINDRSAALPT